VVFRIFSTNYQLTTNNYSNGQRKYSQNGLRSLQKCQLSHHSQQKETQGKIADEKTLSQMQETYAA